MRSPRVRFTLGRTMIAVALLSMLEYYVARLAVIAVSDEDGSYQTIDSRLMWVRLHVPVAFVVFMLWVASPRGERPAAPGKSGEDAREV